MNYLPFDISKVVKTEDWQPNIRTREGRRVKIFTTTQGHEKFPIVGITENLHINSWTKEGNFVFYGGLLNHLDLVCIPEQIYYFANVYLDDIGCAYSSLKAANAARYADYENGKLIRIAYDGKNPIAACLVNRHGEEIKG